MLQIFLQLCKVLKNIYIDENNLGYVRAQGWSRGLAKDTNFSFVDYNLFNSTRGNSNNNSKEMTNLANL